MQCSEQQAPSVRLGQKAKEFAEKGGGVYAKARKSFQLRFPRIQMIRPRLTDYYGIVAVQKDLCFANPFLDEDLPLYVDPFLLWKSPSLQDNSLHVAIIDSINALGA